MNERGSEATARRARRRDGEVDVPQTTEAQHDVTSAQSSRANRARARASVSRAVCSFRHLRGSVQRSSKLSFVTVSFLLHFSLPHRPAIESKNKREQATETAAASPLLSFPLSLLSDTRLPASPFLFTFRCSLERNGRFAHSQAQNSGHATLCACASRSTDPLFASFEA